MGATEGDPAATRASTEASVHAPVMVQEVLAALQPRADGVYLDCTFGGGGHTRAILDASAPDGRVLALDADPAAISRAAPLKQTYGPRLTTALANFAGLRGVVEGEGGTRVDGALFDLGLSSDQLADPTRGFSFRESGPLDMRFGPGATRTAAEVVNETPVEELASLLFRFGDERHGRRIAEAIARARAVAPLVTTDQLARIVAGALPHSRADAHRVHPATRTFQALRIAVNRELEVLREALAAVLELLAPGARLAVISFHSLEDRIVKQFVQVESRGCVCPPRVPVCTCGHHPRLRALTKKPLRPRAEEVARNPRSRSAVLRVAERLA